jgi:hypothetical protein
MKARDAEAIAYVLEGEITLRPDPPEPERPWQVIFKRPDGRIVVLNEMSVDEFGDEEAYRDGQCYASINFR